MVPMPFGTGTKCMPTSFQGCFSNNHPLHHLLHLYWLYPDDAVGCDHPCTSFLASCKSRTASSARRVPSCQFQLLLNECHHASSNSCSMSAIVPVPVSVPWPWPVPSCHSSKRRRSAGCGGSSGNMTGGLLLLSLLHPAPNNNSNNNNRSGIDNANPNSNNNTSRPPLPTIKRYTLRGILLRILVIFCAVFSKKMNYGNRASVSQSCPEPERQFSPTHLLGMAVSTHSTTRKESPTFFSLFFSSVGSIIFLLSRFHSWL